VGLAWGPNLTYYLPLALASLGVGVAVGRVGLGARPCVCVRRLPMHVRNVCWLSGLHTTITVCPVLQLYQWCLIQLLVPDRPATMSDTDWSLLFLLFRMSGLEHDVGTDRPPITSPLETPPQIPSAIPSAPHMPPHPPHPDVGVSPETRMPEKTSLAEGKSQCG